MGKPRKVHKSGNSLVVSLTKEALTSLDVNEGDYVWVDDDTYPVTIRTAADGASKQ
jgi:putative addiction module antidote